jgi:hypothetical protein
MSLMTGQLDTKRGRDDGCRSWRGDTHRDHGRGGPAEELEGLW